MARARWRWFLLGGGAAAALAVAAAVVQPLFLVPVAAALLPGVVFRVDTASPLVALSFDDGPDPAHTPRLLALLARHEVRATFFLVGERAARHPALVGAIRAAGHEIGNHAWADRSIWGLAPAAFAQNLRRTDAALGLADQPRLFRPPGGRIFPGQVAAARALGYLTVLGAAFPFDPLAPPAGYIGWLCRKNLAPGVIVILHDGIPDPGPTFAALDEIIAAGRGKGLRFVTVGELLATSSAARPAPAPGR